MKALFQALFLLLALAGGGSSEILFSSREYARQGQSWQQIAVLDPATGKVTRLTTAPRHHRQPVCGPDDAIYFFSSGKPDEYWPDRELWRFDRATGRERLLTQFPAGKDLNDQFLGGFPTFERILGASRGAVFVEYTGKAGDYIARYAGKLTVLAQACAAEWGPGGTRMICRPCAGPDTLLMDATGKRLGKLDSCGEPMWSGDGKKIACAEQDSIRILDAQTLRAVERIGLPGGSKGTAVSWSPDGRRFLFAAPAEGSNSTSRYVDYFVFTPDTKTWQALPEGGNGAVWLPDGSGIVYVTPRELTGVGVFVRQPGGKILGINGKPAGEVPAGRRERQVWTAQLKIVVFPGLGVKALTSGPAYNTSPAPCRAK